MPLNTDLNVPPYFDDYDQKNSYYQILFKPQQAVQARELTQIQSILQNQISTFGRNIYVDGSIVEGCAFSFDDQYNYVKIADNYANGSSTIVYDLIGLQASNKNGLTGIVVNGISGLVNQAPNTNTIYVKYQNSGTFANGQSQSVFKIGRAHV